jgi:hypothetical protein
MNCVLFWKGYKAKSEMSTESSQTEKESALRTASKNGEVIHVRSLLDEKANPNCTNSVIKIESIIDL